LKTPNRIPFYLTLKYLQRGRKWTLLLTLFLMAVAFVNLIFISSLFSGIIKGTNDQIKKTMTGNIYIGPPEGKEYIEGKDKITAKLKNTEGVVGVSAETFVPGQLKHNQFTGNWQILAIDPQSEASVTNISKKLIEGSYLDPNDEDQILIGRQIAGGEGVEQNAFSFRGVHVGDKVTIVNGTSKEFTIKGIFQTKFINADQRALITEKALNKILPGSEDKTSTIIVKIDKDDNESAVTDRIKTENLGGQIYSWREVAGLMSSVSDSFTSINALMTFVAILIAAVTVFIVIYVDIVNKRKQIGILRAIGIRPYIIIFSYVILSAVYSVLGVLLGTGIFYLVLVPYFNAHPFVLPICDAVLNLSTGDYIARAEAIMWVSVISGLIPSAIITRTKMLDAILGR
jgi:putative ABC transport system permease protein